MCMPEIRDKLMQCYGIHEVLDLLWKMDERSRVEILAMWWTWWTNRNKVCEGGDILAPPDFIHRACLREIRCRLEFCKWEPP